MKAFPRHTIQIHLEDPKAFERFSRSLWEMAVVTGVLVRVVRCLRLTHGSNSMIYVGGTLAVEIIILLGLTTAHLANYTLRHWVWRVPLFALVEVVAELATSTMLIWLKREPNGATSAHWDDWIGMASTTALVSGLTIIIWSLLLGGVVQLLRTRVEQDDPEDIRGAG